LLNLTLKGVDIFIKRSQTNKQETYWNNYDLVIWKENSDGFYDQKGMFRKDTWGIAETISVDNNGIWKLPTKYVRYFK
jgi:hypothetical protein